MSGIKSTSGGTPPPAVDRHAGSAGPQQQIAPVSPTSPSGGQTDAGVQGPSALSHLSEGARLAAIVTAKAGSGDIMLHTEIGNFRMSSSSPLPVGSHVLLEIDSLDDIIMARVVALNGEKLASPPTVSLLPVLSALPRTGTYGMASPSPRDSAPSLQQLNAALVQLGEGRTAPPATGRTQALPAMPHLPATASALPNNLFASQPFPFTDGEGPGSGLRAQSAAAAAYSHTTGARPSTGGPAPAAQPASPAAGGPPAPGDAPIIIRASIQRAPVTQTVTMASGAVVSVQPGQQFTLVANARPDNAPAATQQGVAVSGTVIGVYGGSGKSAGSSHMAQVHVQTDTIGTIRYSQAAPPPVGSVVQLALMEKMAAFPLIPQPSGSGMFKIPQLPVLTDWTSLTDVLNVLAAHDPAGAQSVLSNRIPAANNQLGASLLFFLAALNGGNIDRWLGRDVRASLESSGHQGLLSKLDDDFSLLSRLHSDPGGQDWKLLALPFLDTMFLRQLRIFYRQHGRDPETGEVGETRFIIELDLSRTGPVQLDGLFKRHRFDLMFRFRDPPGEEMERHIGEIFRTNLEITGITGTLTFRQTIPFPAHPVEDWEMAIPGRSGV